MLALSLETFPDRGKKTVWKVKLTNYVRLILSQARTNELAIEDMDGGTFTISNGGVFGSMMGTPIINPPQSAILGMHAIIDRPVAVKGKVSQRLKTEYSPAKLLGVFWVYSIQGVL